MASFKDWLQACRPRTLPLSVSGILIGTGMAAQADGEHPIIFLFSILTTLAFQITSNLANDYGDGVKGTDDESRIGPARALQSGKISARQMKIGIGVGVFLSLVFSICTIYFSFGTENLTYAFLFLILGILSIWAAIKYTVGRNAYGYQGMGDVFVFAFFGILAVLGTKFLYVKEVCMIDFLPAMGIGCLCVGVLNLNNLRDVDSDRSHGKNTLVVKMGFKNGRIYHMLLLTVSFLSFIAYEVLGDSPLFHYFYLWPFILIFIHLRRALIVKEPLQLDPELAKLAVASFLLAFSFYILKYNFF